MLVKTRGKRKGKEGEQQKRGRGKSLGKVRGGGGMGETAKVGERGKFKVWRGGGGVSYNGGSATV